MRLLFILFALSLILAWYAYMIRPAKRDQSNALLLVAGVVLLLLIGGFIRLI